MKIDYSWDIIKKFSGNDQDCFTFHDVVAEYPDTDKIYLSKVLSGMVKKGMLIKLSRNIYHIVPSSEDAITYIPDWHLVAKYLMKGREYYVGYYSAMQIHGLITQPSLKEIIVTNHQVIPSSRKISDVEFQFVTHKVSRFFGFRNTWINQHEKVMVSDLEKTIVDSVTKPHLCGGMVEVGKAIYETRERINLDTLISYLTQNDSRVALKRYLFICELVDVHWTAHHEGLLKNIGTSFSLLDTTGPDQGRKNSRFGLKINIDMETIKNAIFT
jgi:predicted transcriptional regulator of viral defense system